MDPVQSVVMSCGHAVMLVLCPAEEESYDLDVDFMFVHFNQRGEFEQVIFYYLFKNFPASFTEKDDCIICIEDLLR